MAVASYFMAFLSGVAYLGLQTLFLNKLSIFCDHSKAALVVHFYLLFITILLASYIVEARPVKNPERWLRVTGLAIVISHGMAFFALTLWTPDKLAAFAAAWVGGLILTPAAISGGLAFGKFIQIVGRQSSRSTIKALCSIAGGALVAPHAKFLVHYFGPTSAFVFILLSFVALLTVLPAQSAEDEQPEAW